MLKVLVVANSLKTEKVFLREVHNGLCMNSDAVLYNADIDKYIKTFKKKRNFLRILKILPFGYKLYEYVCYKYVDCIAKRILIREEPDVIILGTDNTYFSPFIVKNAKLRNIKCVVIPFTLANQEELVHYCRSTRQYFQSLVHIQFYLTLFGEWFIEDEMDKGRYFLCPIYPHFLIQKFLKIAARNPWIVCGGNSDYVFVNSQFEKDYYVRSGISEGRIMIYSSMQNDVSSISNDDLGQSTDGYIIWSVPPDHLNSRIFKSQKQLIEWHLNLFRGIDRDIVISPHPRLPPNFFDSFILPMNVSISYESIHRLVDGCAYFIAAQSATIRFALAKRKFIINFKVYNLPYSEYSRLPMVCEVESLVGFKKAFYKMHAGVLFSGFEYDGFENDYFESQGFDINVLLGKIIN